jgi:hypothetical protein
MMPETSPAGERKKSLSAIQQLLILAGEKAQCPHCHAEIYLIRNPTNSYTLSLNPDGKNHFRTCPDFLADRV